MNKKISPTIVKASVVKERINNYNDLYRWVPFGGDWRRIQRKISGVEETRLGALLYCLVV